MTVRDLLQQLSKLNPDTEVLCYTEDESLLPTGGQFRLLHIESVDRLDGEPERLDDRTPYLNLGKSDTSQAYVTLIVTSIF